jgi:hypothetical protein
MSPFILESQAQQAMITVTGEPVVAFDVTSAYLLTETRLEPHGHAVRANWSVPSGADTVVVDSASMLLSSAMTEESLGELSFKREPNNPQATRHLIVTIPKSRRIKTLTLSGLSRRNSEGEWVSINSNSNLGGLRLLVDIADPRVSWTPLYTVPEIGTRGGLPRMFTGAQLTSGAVLKLPAEVQASQLRISLVEGSSVEDFQFRDIDVDRIYGKAAIPPTDLELLGPDDGAAWSYPGELLPGAPLQTADYRIPLQAALQAALDETGQADATFRLIGAAPSTVALHAGAPRGALLRTFAGVTRAELSGVPAALPLSGAALASETAGRVSADLTLEYGGIRLLEAVKDPLPPASGAVDGYVVGEAGVLRRFPAGLLHNYSLARIGLVGRAPESCELSLQFVTLVGDAEGQPLGNPSVLQLEASAAIDVNWVDAPKVSLPADALALRVRANKGRFFWATGPVLGGQTQPLLRLAILDPDPGGRPITVDGDTLHLMHEPKVHFPAHSLPAAPFRQQPPVLESDLFVTVDLSDLTLSYERQT